MISESTNQKSITFCNESWRNFIKKICNLIDKDNIGLQIISPFGFELLGDKKFLCKSIKRLYCYIGIPRSHASEFDPYMVSKIFAEQLMTLIREIEINPSEIASIPLKITHSNHVLEAI